MDETTKDILQALKSYRCQFSVDESGDGIELVDLLSPGFDIGDGQKERELLAEHIADELFYKNRG